MLSCFDDGDRSGDGVRSGDGGRSGDVCNNEFVDGCVDGDCVGGDVVCVGDSICVGG